MPRVTLFHTCPLTDEDAAVLLASYAPPKKEPPDDDVAGAAAWEEAPCGLRGPPSGVALPRLMRRIVFASTDGVRIRMPGEGVTASIAAVSSGSSDMI